MSRKLPFHESILKKLMSAEVRLSKNKSIGLFVSRFVIEVQTITNTIENTAIPKENVGTLIAGLQKFYSDFESNYPILENACGGKRERKIIDESFVSTIANLQSQLPVAISA